MIVLGIDDTDIVGSPGTNQLARAIVARLGPLASGAMICRHQLLKDPRVPFTSQNGCASIRLPHGDGASFTAVVDAAREVIRSSFVEGSDPGLCVASKSSAEMEAFAERARREIVTRDEARAIAAGSSCHLEELGGSGQGIIGALAAIPLVWSGENGRVVHLEGWPWPDEFAGPREVRAILSRGVAEIRALGSMEPVTEGPVDVGKHLRPSWRGGRVVLFVEPAEGPGARWRAVKLL